ncbi:MAG: calcium/sodium antiporter [Deltaproteobacteria bacterium]|nr:calcium/sodium antiporter [Deltaproteobacteria bacterium]
MPLNILLLVIGMVLLFLGSEWLVRGASSLALSLAVRPVIVGLTIVAFATSAPELLVSITASIKGSGGISIGNVIGSNVINIALVLGLCSIIKPIDINSQIVNRELLFMCFVSVLFLLMTLDGRMGRVDGFILLVLQFLFIIYGIFTSKDKNAVTVEGKISERKEFFRLGLLIIVGLLALGYGAHIVVKVAVFIAKEFGLSEVFIGLSIVAFGTSLPELATSGVAIIKDKSDLSIGNVVGSNIFNICLVMGFVGFFSPIDVDNKVNFFESPLMIIMAFSLYYLGLKRKIITQKHGLIYVGCFFLYIFVSFILA